METNDQNTFIVPPAMPPAEISNTAVQPKHRMKWLWRIVLLIVVVPVILGGLAIFLPSILSLLFPGDAELADDSYLRLQKIAVPTEKNGFFDLNRIAEDELYINAGSFDLDYTKYGQAPQWDQSLVDQVLNQNSAALDSFSQAAQKEFIQLPDYADPANLRVEMTLYSMSPWRGTARLQAIKALFLARQGSVDEALLEAVKLNQVGHKMTAGQNSLIGTLVGIAMNRLGSETILQILSYGNFRQETLETVKNLIRDSSNNIDGYKNGFRFEYTHLSNSIDEVTRERLKAEFQAGSEDSELDPIYAKLLNYSYYYKPNQTKNLYIDLYRIQLEAVGKRCELDDYYMAGSMENRPTWSSFVTENAVGKLLFSISGVTLGSVLTKGCENDLAAVIAETQLAMSQYKLDHRSLPVTLNDLVPQYLQNVPLDPFDHQPIRYSSEKKILYSVGLKKLDLGGSDGLDWAKMDNPTFKIGF